MTKEMYLYKIRCSKKIKSTQKHIIIYYYIDYILSISEKKVVLYCHGSKGEGKHLQNFLKITLKNIYIFKKN